MFIAYIFPCIQEHNKGFMLRAWEGLTCHHLMTLILQHLRMTAKSYRHLCHYFISKKRSVCTKSKKSQASNDLWESLDNAILLISSVLPPQRMKRPFSFTPSCPCISIGFISADRPYIQNDLVIWFRMLVQNLPSFKLGGCKATCHFFLDFFTQAHPSPMQKGLTAALFNITKLVSALKYKNCSPLSLMLVLVFHKLFCEHSHYV